MVLLSGCSSLTGPQSNVNADNQFAATPEYYLGLAQQTQGDASYGYQLQAVQQYIRNKNYPAADKTLSAIPSAMLAPQQSAQFLLLAAQLNLVYDRPGKAYTQLSNIVNTDQLPVDMQVQQQQLLAQAYMSLGQTVNAIKSRLQLSKLLTDPLDIRQNNQAIWHASQSVNDNTLQQFSTDDSQPSVEAWASLTLISRRYTNNPEILVAQLRAWRQKFSDNPANNLLAHVLPDAGDVLSTPKHIALLLPMNNQFTPQAQAILNGFMQAYYQTPLLQRPQLSIVDTSQINMKTAYQQAAQDGADFIVGPLMKDHVNSLADYGPDIPVLALNYGSMSDSPPDNFYQLGLSPDNEATQAALRMWKNGKSRVITITVAGDWGQSIVNDFSQRFQNLGGQVVASLAIDTKNNLTDEIAELMNVDRSQARAAALRKTLGEKFTFIPRRRQDIDAIFINAPPGVARQVLPLLRFYYAGNTPVYATSVIFNGIAAARRDSDLNGVMFTDMPWAIAPTAGQVAIRKQFATLWSSNFAQYSKLYALGIDTYHMMSQLNRLKVFPQSAFHGFTGTLYLEPNGHLYRQLPWARFVRGTPQLVKQ
tara:strand:- start:13785 stop:15557 length:1773 start_codon:yes stop_codon:yes gene_type:complete